MRYSVSLTLSEEADSEEEAIQEFLIDIRALNFDDDSFVVEEEYIGGE